MTRSSLAARTVAGVALALGALAAATPCLAAEIALPPGPGRALVYGQCRTCHDLQYLVESAGVPRETWNELLDSMQQYGLRIDADQRAQILDYLGTYLGPNPPPAAAASASATVSATATSSASAIGSDGAAVFRDQCAACHQPSGQGVAGQFPPLANSPDLFLSRDFPPRVVLFGLSGKIQVGGRSFDAAMPPLGILGDREIAAVVNYVRQAWGNDRLRPKTMAPLNERDVARLRAGGGSPEQTHAARAQLSTKAAAPSR